MRADLMARLALVADAAASVGDTRLETWDALADRLGRLAQARVTFIAADGRVLGDSDVALADLPGLENHLSRPEVAQALAQNAGSSMRWSATVKERLMYAAIPVAFPDGT